MAEAENGSVPRHFWPTCLSGIIWPAFAGVIFINIFEVLDDCDGHAWLTVLLLSPLLLVLCIEYAAADTDPEILRPSAGARGFVYLFLLEAVIMGAYIVQVQSGGLVAELLLPLHALWAYMNFRTVRLRESGNSGKLPWTRFVAMMVISVSVVFGLMLTFSVSELWIYGALLATEVAIWAGIVFSGRLEGLGEGAALREANSG